MCLARRTASELAILDANYHSRSSHREIFSIWPGVSFVRASIPRALLRTKAFKALIERVRALTHGLLGGHQYPQALTDPLIEARTTQPINKLRQHCRRH
ncbi:hypothetical protein ABIB48_001740 [Arthrobacter sp. UYCu511]